MIFSGARAALGCVSSVLDRTSFFFALPPLPQLGFSCLSKGMGRQKEKNTRGQVCAFDFPKPSPWGCQKEPLNTDTEQGGRGERHEEEAKGDLRWEEGKSARLTAAR